MTTNKDVSDIKKALERDGHDIRAYEKQAAQRKALEWFDDTTRNYERMAQEIKRYRDRFVEAMDDPNPKQFTSPVEIIGWAISSANQANSNVRFDLAAKAMVELDRTRE